ncbi:MAG: hypothetical protein ACR2PQ_05210 [Myxococcota bacterium]
MSSVPPTSGPEAPLRCDFCGEEAASVRRVALDANYERLQTPHKERYACPNCSERKDRERRGLESHRR